MKCDNEQQGRVRVADSVKAGRKLYVSAAHPYAELQWVRGKDRPDLEGAAEGIYKRDVALLAKAAKGNVAVLKKLKDRARGGQPAAPTPSTAKKGGDKKAKPKHK